MRYGHIEHPDRYEAARAARIRQNANKTCRRTTLAAIAQQHLTVIADRNA